MMDSVTVSTVGSIADVPPAWDALAAGHAPFLSRAWLAATEDDGPVALEEGWTPHHVLVHEAESLVAAIPVYVRDRSDGEFIWHGTMEEVLTRYGLPSAPRAVGTLPATPVPSARLLTSPAWSNQEGRRAVLGILARLGDSVGWASTHLQFCEESEAQAGGPDWIHRLSRQARWRRGTATTVEEWLGSYRSKRRTSIRREMKELDRQGLRLAFVRGSDAPDSLFMEAADLYAATAIRYGEKPRFGRSFFAALSEPPLRDSVLFVTATNEAEKAIGIATKVVHDGVLYGRLWGAADRVRFLHFNVAVYGGVRYCLEHGLDRFEPGHGGFHKERRGFPTEPVHSLHRYLHPGAHEAFAGWAERESAWMRERINESEGESGLR